MKTAPTEYIERMPWKGLRNYEGRVADGQLRVLVGQEPFGKGGRMGWHLSISHTSRIPTWDEIREARYKLVPDQAHMAMILPPRAEYVNVHPTTMHLYEVEA
jgi:hypothetical protein